MSRIGVMPITIPAGADVSIQDGVVNVRGSKGEQDIPVLSGTAVDKDDAGQIVITRTSEDRTARERHGLMRTLIANAVHGVTDGFSRSLEVSGVGFKVQVSGDSIELNVGYSHPEYVTLPEGITADVDGNVLTIHGIDKQSVGQVAANVRRVRPPEPYKGKGIAYTDERVRRKTGKAAGGGK